MFAYTLFTWFLSNRWLQIEQFSGGSTLNNRILISVIIPVRNEGENIENLLQDLNSQDLSTSEFEVLIVDDHSEDNTREIVRNFPANYALSLWQLPANNEGRAGKKRAITMAIEKAKGELIVATDGDCRVGEKWLLIMKQFHLSTKAKFIAGPVTFSQEKSLFEKMQTVEFASLTGSGAACLAAGLPNMCNGANIAYTRKVFQQVKGYAGDEHIASGDDEFLMHKIFELYPTEVRFLKSDQAIVYTSAKKSLKDFFYQRKRWSGKWKHYRFNNIRYIAAFIFCVNLVLIVSLFLSCFRILPVMASVLLFMIKGLADYLFLHSILKFYKKKNPLSVFLLTSLIYPFYVIFFGFLSNYGGYQWKGRNNY